MSAIVILYLHDTFVQASLVDANGVLKDHVSVSVSYTRDPFENMRFYNPDDVLYGIKSSLSTLYKTYPQLMESLSCLSIISSCYMSFFWDKQTGNVLSKGIYHRSVGLETYETKLTKYIDQTQYKKSTGAYLSSSHAIVAYKWLRDNCDDLPASTVFTSIESWVLSQLTQNFNPCVDVSCASRYGALNLNSGCWDHDICRDIDLNPGWLPMITSSSSYFGSVTQCLPFLEGKPIFAMVEDKQSLLLSNGSTNYGGAHLQADFSSISFLFNAGSEIDDMDTRNLQVLPLASDLEGLFLIESQIAIPSFPSSLCHHDVLQSFVSPDKELKNDGLMMFATPQKETIVSGMTSKTTDRDLILSFFRSVAFHIKEYITHFEEVTEFKLKTIRLGGELAGFDTCLFDIANFVQKPIIKVQRSYELILGAVYLVLHQLPLKERHPFLKALRQHYRQCIPIVDPHRSEGIYSEWLDKARKVRL